MLYMIVGTDVENSLEKRSSARPGHIARLKSLQDQGRLVLSGPNPAIDSADPSESRFSGSLIVAEFNSLQDAQDWMDADPYVSAGVYRHVVVKPFKKFLPA